MNEQQFELRLKNVEEWQKKKDAQQIKFPLDVESQVILNKYFMAITKFINYEVVGAAAHTVYLYLGSQENQNFQVSQQTIFQYTVNVTSNKLTVPDVPETVGFVEDAGVHLNTTAAGTLPAPLAVNTTYYIKSLSKSVSGFRFVLAATPGGATINITTTGDGPQYIEADT